MDNRQKFLPNLKLGMDRDETAFLLEHVIISIIHVPLDVMYVMILHMGGDYGAHT